MATYVNNLRLKEIATGDESGTWGTSTNTNLELVTDGFSYGTKAMAADANETFTMPDGTADDSRSFYLKITSGVSLTATREVTLGPNTVSKVWMIENATSGSQIITIKQGSGATVNVANGSKVMVVTDGAGAGAAVLNANPTEAGTGTVTSVGGTGTVNGISLSGTVTSSGNLTLGGTLANVDLTSQVTGTLPIANGGTGTTSTTFANLTTNVTGTLPVANGGTGTTSTTFANLTTNVTGTLPIANGGTNLTALGTANQVLAVNAGGTALEYQSAATGSVTSVDVSGGTTGLTTSGGPVTSSGTVTLAGTLAVANGGTNATTAAGARASLSANALPILKGTSYTAVVGEFIVASAGGITITLPATPSAGDTVTVKDGTGDAATTTFTVARNGSNIAASATDLIFDKNYAEITMTYIDGTIGWSV